MNKIRTGLRWINLRVVEERGAGLAEYALLLFVVAVVASTVLLGFSDSIQGMFTNASDVLPVEVPVDAGTGG